KRSSARHSLAERRAAERQKDLRHSDRDASRAGPNAFCRDWNWNQREPIENARRTCQHRYVNANGDGARALAARPACAVAAAPRPLLQSIHSGGGCADFEEIRPGIELLR